MSNNNELRQIELGRIYKNIFGTRAVEYTLSIFDEEGKIDILIYANTLSELLEKAKRGVEE